MSADDWNFCPRCMAADDEKREALAALIRNEYGVLPLEEHDALRAQLAAWPSIEQSFREDYEWFHDNGVVFGSFKGHCKTCSLKVDVRVDKKFWPEEPVS